MKKAILLITLCFYLQNIFGQWITMQSLPIHSNRIAFSSPDSGWVASRWDENSVPYRTVDGGKTWTKSSIYGENITSPTLNIFFKNGLEGFISRYGNSLKTNDGGNTWNTFTQPSLESNTGFQSLQFLQNSYIGLTTGGITIKFNDRESVVRKPNYNLSKAYFCDTLVGYALSGLTLRKTVNGGASWSALGNLPRENYIDLWFTSPTIGVAVGQSGTIVYTNDGGLSWKVLSGNKTNFSYSSIFFTTSKTGYICGDQGTILKTVDGGVSWKPMRSGTFEDLYALNFPNSTIGYCVGANGVVLKLIEDLTVPQVTSIVIPNLKLCAGASYSLSYTVNKKFSNDNVFTAFLSDANGDFNRAVAIGTSNSDTSGIIKITIPANTQRNLGYRIRIESSSPQSISPSNDNFLEIQPSVTPTIAITADTRSICAGETLRLSSSTSGIGSSPQITWFEKNKIIGSGAILNYIPKNNDSLRVSVKSNLECSIIDSAVSSVVIVRNPISVTTPVTAPNQLITLNGKALTGINVRYLSNGTICQGTTVDFNTFLVNGGTAPKVLWYNNKTIIGEGQKFNFVPKLNDKIFAVLKSSLECNQKDSSVSMPTNFVDSLPQASIPEVSWIKIVTPIQPKISKILNELTSSAKIGNQWYKNNEVITNANQQKYITTSTGSYKVQANDGICPALFSEEIKVDIITSIEATNLTSGLKIYPNPASEMLSIESSILLEKFIIYQAQGQKLWVQEASNSIDLSKLATGLYLLEVWDFMGNKGLIKFAKQ